MNDSNPLPFLAFLHAGLERGGFETDDALAALLPLMRDTLAAHEQGCVAPLHGIGDLILDAENRLGFDAAQAGKPRRSLDRVEELQQAAKLVVELVKPAPGANGSDAAALPPGSLAIGRPDEPVSRPVFLPGYLSWEHLCEHHDELTDIFSLGLLLASVACGLDLSDPAEMERFAHSRENLFELNARLNPVVATVIVQMTELNRHKRAQDLASLIGRLEHYREQSPDLDFNRIPGFKESAVSSRRKLIHTHLRARLFDISRGNRLIHFKPSRRCLNLTLASVPTVLDYRNIRQEQLFAWHPALATEIISGEPVALGKYLRFEDASELSSDLDRIINEATRDRAEYGFSELRLVLVFLRWHNLKEAPDERIHSPLLLLPVEVTRKIGVRDSYMLTAITGEAEVNPILRYYLKQLYNLDLPETVDLHATSLEAFCAQLQQLLQASEPAVVLQTVAQPKLELLHEHARRRLDLYRQRTQIKGPMTRPAAPPEYSYDRDHPKPLGVQLFESQIKPAPAPLRQGAAGTPKPKLPQALGPAATPPGKPDKEVAAGDQASTPPQEQQAASGNPYAWEFDLCAMTLGNFNYRKMTLVRDYANLIETDLVSEAFDQIFSLEPKPPEAGPVPPLPLAEQYVVIPCDGTQASAVARARTGASYIIQGPPGTGKSQTITNLIADYIARGKRVLFVCEKRAAIDVVFYRLRQQGLDELCCLIHDSQADKKPFILNLKQTCEQWLVNAASETGEKKREAARSQMDESLSALARFSEAMSAPVAEAGLPVRALLQRLIELREHVVELSPEEEERLPGYADWLRYGALARKIADTLADLGEEPCLARHPFRWLHPSIVQAEHPLEMLRQRLEPAETLLGELEEALAQSGLEEKFWDTLQKVEALLGFAARAKPLAERNLLDLLDAKGPAASELAEKSNEFQARVRAHANAALVTGNWREKLPPAEVRAALIEARSLARSSVPLLHPAWWRLRRVLQERYDFSRHAVKPSPLQVLEELAAEQRAAAAADEARQQSRHVYGTDDLAQFAQKIAQLHETVAQPSETIAAMRRRLLSSAEGPALVASLAQLHPRFRQLRDLLNLLLVDFESHSLAELGEAVRDIHEAAQTLPDLVPVLAELAECPAPFARLLRQFALEVPELEAAVARKTLSGVYRQDRELHSFNGRALAGHMEKLDQHYQAWLPHNTATIRNRVRQRFFDHANVAAMSAAALPAEQREFKRRYAAGRRELEQEFSKTMRFKSIRELAGGDTGEVVRDLKPIWLMSPLSVSDTLPLDPDLFDVVIFDEASQVPLEEAVPALYRARQVIVVGDEMQLPPTSFFTAGRNSQDELVVEEEGERIEVSLDADSLLTRSARNLPSTLLAWHYRSRYEALISFSNAAFYGGNLFTIPDRLLPAADAKELLVSDPVEGDKNADAVLERSISFHFLENSVYESRRNPAEASYIAHLVRKLLRRKTGLSVGILAFSEAQQAEIEDALQALSKEDPAFSARLEAEYAREENDQFCGLFIKNLENVQGDERDIIILSICYGRDGSGRMRMNFGPINQSGGEKRLNVILSRAKHHLAVVSSIRHHEITNDYNDGANALKNFLRFAELVSRGDLSTARQVLAKLNPLNRKAVAAEPPRHPVLAQLSDALRTRGYVADLNVGQSRFRCDLAVRREGDTAHQLGILLDSEAHYANPNLLERYLVQPSVLRAFGWRVGIVLTKDWFHAPDLVLNRLERLLKDNAEGAGKEEPQPEPEAGSKPASAKKNGRATAAPHHAERSAASDTEPAAPSPRARNGDADAPEFRRFEFTSGTCRKFWEIAVDGANYTTRFGRIGAAAQEQSKACPSAAQSRRQANKLVAEKLKKGYKEVQRDRANGHANGSSSNR